MSLKTCELKTDSVTIQHMEIEDVFISMVGFQQAASN